MTFLLEDTDCSGSAGERHACAGAWRQWLHVSSRKMRVLGQFTIHMVEFIQLNTNQPHVWLEFRHLPSFSVSQPRVWFRHKLKL